jgi:serine/threonine-protein phosphatase 6 catalytic subunit
MWSDPDDIEAWVISQRGAGYVFGWKVVNEFNRINDLTLVCRAHQLVNEGYKYWFKDKNLVTVWSAPNYCYRCGNKAGILKLDKNKNRTSITFDSVPKSKESATIKTLVPYFL